jgi:DNA polymerase-4
VGKVTGRRFDQLGIRTIGQLGQLSMAALEDLFGSSAEHYWKLCRGIDGRRVIPDREAKSISHETTFQQNVDNPEVLHAWLVELVEQVARRLRRYELKGRTIDLKVRFADFRTINRSATLLQPTNTTQQLLEAGLQVLQTRLPEGHLPIPLLGFGVSGIDGSGVSQRQLFDETEQQRQRGLDAVADQIVGKFGRNAIRRAGGAAGEKE